LFTFDDQANFYSILMEKLLITSLILSLVSCTNTAKQPILITQGLAGLVSTSQLACRYEKQTQVGTKTQTTNWYFWRQLQHTETRDELSNQGEIWEAVKTSGFYYTRLFYNEKVAIDWTNGDLMATGSTPSIKQINSIIDPDMLGKELSLQSKANVNGMPTEFYTGQVNGIVTEVDWLPTFQLPAHLEKKLPEGTVTLSLSECHKDPKFPIKPITKAELNSFRHLDYTDLGDMEDDPMVHHIEQLLGNHSNN
jgi:hypothetical protein